jgi:hypothetical protein
LLPGGKPLSLSEICWRSGVPIEGEQAAILELVVDRVPRSEHYSVLQCCGLAVRERPKRFEVRGWRQKVRMSNFKVQNPNNK